MDVLQKLAAETEQVNMAKVVANLAVIQCDRFNTF